MIRGTSHLTGNRSYIRYCDGWGKVYKVKDRTLTNVKQDVVHYQRTAVGERRYWDAQVAGVSIDMAIYVPAETNISRGDVMMIDGSQYLATQVDYRDRVSPASLHVSLTATPIAYKDATGNG